VAKFARGLSLHLPGRTLWTTPPPTPKKLVTKTGSWLIFQHGTSRILIRATLTAKLGALKETGYESVNLGEMLPNSTQWQPFVVTVWNFRLHGPLSLASPPGTRQLKEENADWKLNSHNHVVDRRRGINSTSDREDRYVGFWRRQYKDYVCYGTDNPGFKSWQRQDSSPAQKVSVRVKAADAYGWRPQYLHVPNIYES
jgi:hypothetical protein